MLYIDADESTVAGFPVTSDTPKKKKKIHNKIKGKVQRTYKLAASYLESEREI